MRRLSMLALVLLLGVITASRQDKQQTQTILFVCEHGSAKSVIAAAHFNRLAEQRGLPYRAIARGINPDREIPQQVRFNLAKDGLDVTTWKPQRVADKDVREAARVVTFGCRLPFPEKSGAGKFVDWQDVPSTSEDYERVRTMIVNKIDALLKTLVPNEAKASP
jgi:arsenate reductase (thioredoxin)